jgi:REP element-mobilizing transposase RayT
VTAPLVSRATQYLMPNHVHLILAPSDADGLRAALDEADRRYTRHVKARELRGRNTYLLSGPEFPRVKDYVAIILVTVAGRRDTSAR